MRHTLPINRAGLKLPTFGTRLLHGLVSFIFLDFLNSLYFENVLQEYACTGVGWAVRLKSIFEYRVG